MRLSNAAPPRVNSPPEESHTGSTVAMHTNTFNFAAANYERLVTALVRGGGKLAESLTRARLGVKTAGWPEIVALAATADQRELIMSPIASRRDEFKAAVEKAAIPGGTTTDSDFAGPLVAYQQLASGWLASLRN